MPAFIHCLIKKLALGQSHFLAASEQKASPWAQKAHSQLQQSYQGLWDLLQEPPLNKELSGDPQGQMKQKQWFQLQAASDFYDLLLKFEEQRHPKTEEKSLAGELLQKGRDWRQHLETFVAGLNLGPELIRKHPVRNRPLPKSADWHGSDEPKAFKEDSKNRLPEAPRKEKSADEDIGQDPNL